MYFGRVMVKYVAVFVHQLHPEHVVVNYVMVVAWSAVLPSLPFF